MKIVLFSHAKNNLKLTLILFCFSWFLNMLYISVHLRIFNKTCFDISDITFCFYLNQSHIHLDQWPNTLSQLYLLRHLVPLDFWPSLECPQEKVCCQWQVEMVSPHHYGYQRHASPSPPLLYWSHCHHSSLLLVCWIDFWLMQTPQLCSIFSKLDVEKNIQNFVNVRNNIEHYCTVLWVSVCVCVCECVCVSNSVPIVLLWTLLIAAVVEKVWTSSTRIWPHSLLSTGLGYWDYRTTYNNAIGLKNKLVVFMAFNKKPTNLQKLIISCYQSKWGVH